ncbi:uncharacterized protein LY89DRAFT_34331 [Mollisia scopiformis]|uniref:Uncharacterized protein n=1 Tax=Mollisia scopiformis TaxID=149040 RepID=A0A194XCV2_MOLSC|nr:uncharacterized protein LY89DRAFT_34331 [Mollisia scopiformis]KUJ17981.1 hypothetical protein LY89DRAFT_34331 [Mollisia scopiformis]
MDLLRSACRPISRLFRYLRYLRYSRWSRWSRCSRLLLCYFATCKALNQFLEMFPERMLFYSSSRDSSQRQVHYVLQ